MYLPVPVYGNKCYYVPWCGGWPHGWAHVYMSMIILCRPECMGTCFFKGGVCDTYGNSGEFQLFLVISVN